MSLKTSHTLFHARTVDTAIAKFAFPPDLAARHEQVKKWARSLRSGTLDQMKEVSLHGEFLHDVFQKALGYTSVIEGEGRSWEIHAEPNISEGGGAADGALGFFTATTGVKGRVSLQGRVIAPIELKAVRTDLDRPTPGRRESPVEQGWRYANYTRGCRWILISNYQEIRIYETTRTPAYYEKFTLTELEEFTTFQRFYFLACRENFLPPAPDSKQPSVTDRLLMDSQEAQEQITDRLYREFKDLRLDITTHFQTTGPLDLENREAVLIEKAQKLLDRVLFVAFCEDRRLLPKNTLKDAHDHRDRYNPRPIWENIRAVFRWVDQGNDELRVPPYNGGLFKADPLLDSPLFLPDALCTRLKDLARFDFDSEVSVDVLGHIFEQSISDLEELKAKAAGIAFDEKKGKRKTQGVFYTPAFITQYIVETALGGYLEQQEQRLRARFELDKIPERATKKRQEAETRFWETYRDDVLKRTRVVDPACGSGAFLIAAFDHLARQYERVNRALEAAGGQRALFDLDATILNRNLYGVDLSPESVEITKLSLWLKTASSGKPLTYLDDNIVVGNSIVDDPSVAPLAVRWKERFPEAFADGGFDVVIGNPPYVRQELLTPFKPYLQGAYESFDGVADLFTYFYELGLKILRPGGRMSYIVTNKWLRSNYGAPLRRFFSLNGVVEQLLDFGHAPIFQDADTFPCIVTLRRPDEVVEKPVEKPEPMSPVQVCAVPRERLANINLRQYVQESGFPVPWSRFTGEAWSLEPPEVEALMEKIRQRGVPLREFVGKRPLYGIKTGLNEAFLINDETRQRLVREDPGCESVIKPYLRGQDIARWNPKWAGLWFILMKSSGDHLWPWANRGDDAEAVFRSTFPSIYGFMKTMESALRARQDQGRFWWELRPCAYYDVFDLPKLMYQEIQFHSAYAYDTSGVVANNKVFILPQPDHFVLSQLNSPLMWWYTWRFLPHMKDDALSPASTYMELLPLVEGDERLRAIIGLAANSVVRHCAENAQALRDILDWLGVERGIRTPGQRLEDIENLEPDDFVAEVKKRQPRSAGGVTPASLKVLRQVYSDYVPAMRQRQAEIVRLEHQLSDLVMDAYGLTPEERGLVWRTAPPRMPVIPSAGYD